MCVCVCAANRLSKTQRVDQIDFGGLVIGMCVCACLRVCVCLREHVVNQLQNAASTLNGSVTTDCLRYVPECMGICVCVCLCLFVYSQPIFQGVTSTPTQPALSSCEKCCGERAGACVYVVGY